MNERKRKLSLRRSNSRSPEKKRLQNRTETTWGSSFCSFSSFLCFLSGKVELFSFLDVVPCFVSSALRRDVHSKKTKEWLAALVWSGSLAGCDSCLSLCLTKTEQKGKCLGWQSNSEELALSLPAPHPLFG